MSISVAGAIKVHQRYGVDFHRSTMWHEIGHAFANFAAGRRSRIRIARNGFGRAEFSLLHKLDCLDEIFVAASGTAAQLVYLEKNSNALYRSCTEHERSAFHSLFVEYANVIDWENFRRVCPDAHISRQNFLRFSERLASRIERLPAVLQVIGDMSRVPANLPAEQIEIAGANVSKTLAELRRYARRSVRGLSRPR